MSGFAFLQSAEPIWLLSLVIIGIHFGLLALLCLFGLHRFYLVGLRFRHRNFAPTIPGSPQEWPAITVQIPLYNEPRVAARIIEAVALLDYPKERLQIQILDDSTDATLEIVRNRVQALREKGIPIEYIHRENRSGYKAGALANGLESATGEFIAIFDADFIPPKDFLMNAIPNFAEPNLGVVQARWGHLNRNENRLTKVQAVRLDAHFSIEQSARSAAGLHFNFNGTAGVWRLAAIRDAGGWQGDTLTEDLDLSYRAQLRGWQFAYLPSQECPAELPTTLAALETQQHRWAKGATQVLLKLAPTIWRSKWSLGEKLESTFHLAGNIAYLAMIVDTLFFLVPSLFARQAFQWQETIWIDIPMLLLSTGGHICFFVAGQHFAGRSLPGTIKLVPSLLATGIGFAINDAKAVYEALRGHSSEFVRTPKRGDQEDELDITSENRQHLSNAHRPEGTALGSPASKAIERFYMLFRPELIVGIGYGLVTIWSFQNGLWTAFPFLLLLHIGFLGNAIRRLRDPH